MKKTEQEQRAAVNMAITVLTEELKRHAYERLYTAACNGHIPHEIDLAITTSRTGGDITIKLSDALVYWLYTEHG